MYMQDLIIDVIILVVFLVIEFKNIPLLSVLAVLVINKELILRYADLPKVVETRKCLEALYIRQKIPP